MAARARFLEREQRDPRGGRTLASVLHRLGRTGMLLACLAALPAAASPGSRAPQAPKRLIEMGWDEPDPGFMRRHLAQLEASPFDGCVYHLLYETPAGPGRFTWDAWGTRAFTEAEIDSGLHDLMATPFKRFRWNFLRFNVTPGRIDWFDDHSAVLSNARLAASVARRGRSAGIFLDTEPYMGPLFHFPSQRDAKQRGFAAYEAQVRLRGAQVMRAFEQGYPGLTVFLSVGSSTQYRASLGGDRRENARYGLLTAFVDGMVSAASDSAKLVDGSEDAYNMRDPARLAPFHDTMTRGVLTWVGDSTRYRRVVSRSFGFWLDYDSPHRGWNTLDLEKNYRSPAALQAVVRRALELADDYVWVYSEKPRWWTTAGGREHLPEAYVQALREARRGLAP